MRTTTAIITARTVWEGHGIGAGIIPLGIHGAIPHGDTADGMTHGTADGTTHGIIQHGMIRSGTEDGTDGMTHGTTEAIGTTTITADGTEDGTRIGDITVRNTEGQTTAGTYGTAQDMRQDPKGYSAAARPSEAA